MTIDLDITKIALAIATALPPTILALAAWHQSKVNSCAIKELPKTIFPKIEELPMAIIPKIEELLNATVSAMLAEIKERQSKESQHRESVISL